MVALPLAAFTAVLLWPSAGPGEAEAATPLALASEDELRARLWPTSADELDAAQPVIDSGAGTAGGGEAGFDRSTVRVQRGGGAESVRFTICDGGARINCVVDGDTFWFGGAKIRLADINTPEVSEPRCAREAALGRAATARLLTLLNAGPFEFGPNPDGRDRDRYGRLLRTVSRGGESLGAVLVREGLAETWQGRRGTWC